MRSVRTGTSLMIALVAALFLVGCEEFNARRKINEANTLFKTGKFEAARDLYESALKDEDIDVGHFNLGVTYVKLFIPGGQTPENKTNANKAAEHLHKWLEKHPKDNDARKMMTKVWVDSGDYTRVINGDYPRRQDDAQAKVTDAAAAAARSYTETFNQSQDAVGKLIHDVAGVLGSAKVWLDDKLRRSGD